jgi:hypothetical protein
MSSFKPVDEHFERAFTLAYFINGSKEKAASIVSAAMNKLEVAATAQFKRLYYNPARRSPSQTAKAESHRTKVSLSDLHLLQRLIYIESEPYEKEREGLQDQGTPDEDLMLIHFIKHLVRITIKRNSFYVTLGVSRLLHNYSTAETMEIYNVAVQDPERVKDDYYYRSRKGRLIQEMKERFGPLINVIRGPRGQERFETQDSPEDYVELVTECLNQFAPWNTQCPVPVEFDPIGDEIRPLTFNGSDVEDKIEINRIHAIIHPSCYGRITKALELELPARRLDIPHFFLPGGKNDMKRPGTQHRRHTQPLGPDELEAIKGTLSKQSARRKTTHAGLLSIVVDGRERARLDLKRSNSINLGIEDGDELIEVRALKEGQETLLASHLLDASEITGADAPLKAEIILEGGQKLSFLISPVLRVAADTAEAGMTISYEETRWLPAASLYLRRAAFHLADAYSPVDGRARAFLKPALAGLVLMLGAGLLVLFIARGFRQPTPAPMELAQSREPSAINAAETPVPTPASVNALVQERGKTRDAQSTVEATVSKAPSGPGEKSTRGRVERGRVKLGSSFVREPGRSHQLPTQSDSSPTQSQAGIYNPQPGDASSLAKAARTGEDATRALPPASAATALAKVKKIYLDISGDRRLAQQSGRLLSQSLRAGQRLYTTDNKDEADAALKLDIREINARKAARGDERKEPAEASANVKNDEETETLSAVVRARLVNEDGAVIWPGTNRKPERRYNGRLTSVMRQIAVDLLEDIRKSETKSINSFNHRFIGSFNHRLIEEMNQ